MERVRILSDYSSSITPNILTLIYDDQGDVHVGIYQNEGNDKGVRIAASGTRHSARVRKAFYELIQAYKEELADPDCHPDLSYHNS